MYKYPNRNMWLDEKELLLGLGSAYAVTHGKWFTKKQVVSIIGDWDCCGSYIKVGKILWNKKSPWNIEDTVEFEQIAFDMKHDIDLERMVEYLFQASIEGYTIRFVSSDTYTGLYLERAMNFKTNIDADTIDTLVDVVNRKFKK